MISVSTCDFDNDALLDEFVAIDKQSFNGQECWAADNFKQINLLKNQLSCYVHEEQVAKGFLVASAYEDADKLSKFGHINRIVVAQNTQGKGFGAMMVHHFEKAAGLLGLEALTLEARNDAALHKFYSNLGYTQLSGDDLEKYLHLKKKLHKLAIYVNQEQLIYRKTI